MRADTLKTVLELKSIADQIVQIQNRQYNSPEDFMDMLFQIEPLVKRARQIMLVLQQNSVNPSNSQDSQFQAMLSITNDVITLREQEIAVAHKMQGMSPEERKQAVLSELGPLFKRETEAASRLAEMQKKKQD